MSRSLSLILLASLLSFSSAPRADQQLAASVDKQYSAHLEGLFKYFHANPELSLVEHKTAARMAKELKKAGFKITKGVGGTGIVIGYLCGCIVMARTTR